MPYILVRGNLASYSHKYPWRVLVSGLKASDIEQLSRFASGGYCDDSTIVYLQHPCVILTALEVLGYKVVASSSTSVKQDYNEYMWTMRKDFSEPEPETIVKTPASTMVKKRGLVWTYYNKKVNGTNVIAFCKFCNRSYIQNATRMEKHLARCEKATPEVKQLFLRVSTSKRVNRARLLGAKIGGSWMKANGDVTLDISSLTEADLEDINECMRNEKAQAQAENNDEDIPVQSLEVTCDNDDEQIAWADDQDIEKSPSRNSIGTRQCTKIWINEENDQEIITEDYDDSLGQSRSRRLSMEPQKSSIIQTYPTPRVARHSPLQTKILQEQLLERRAMRKLAELEMKRKTIEFERYQWEYERDKTRADLKWAHETRMMQLREEREQKLLQETTALPSTK
ncbi:hypothetical protein PV326_004343 [Microctonus aethiopoides]|nr:hypothetical protein PV326_004343 [Microctonus aethiopoides]